MIVLFILLSSLMAFEKTNLESLIVEQQNVLEELSEIKLQDFYLTRFDLQVALDSSGDIGILSAARGSAFELIWQRRQPLIKDNDIIEFHMSQNESVEELTRKLSKVVFTKVKKVRRGVRRRFLKLLKRDLRSTKQVIEKLRVLPRVSSYYLSDIQLAYTLNTGISFPGVSVDKEKRIRFRLKVLESLVRDEPRVNEYSEDIVEKLASIPDYNDSTFYLGRVFLDTQVSTKVSAWLLSFKGSRNFRLVFRKHTQPFLSRLSLKLNSVEHFELPQVELNSEKSFYLSQLRVKFDYEITKGFKLVEVGKKSAMQLHFFRRTSWP